MTTAPNSCAEMHFPIYADEIGDPAPKKLLSTDDVNAQMIVPLARKYFEENKTVDAAEASRFTFETMSH